MLGTKNDIFVDRRVYAFKGKWKDPKQDIERTCYYFVKENTLVESYENGKETIKPRITIVVFGEFPFCARDIFTLQDGSKLRIQGSPSINYVESNITIRDMLKQRIGSMVLILE